jgi:uncharacterized protein (DUF2252 family)
MNSVTEKIIAFNANRIPAFVKLKYGFLQEDVFRFYRGTCHLFYEALAKNITWEDNTKCWITGDLHLENFGTYKGDNHVVYFDMNDFDEALLAPATWEVSRLLTSIYLAGHVLKFNEGVADELCSIYLDTYINTLKSGKPAVVEKETASGLLKYFIEKVQERRLKDFVLGRTEVKGKQRKLTIDNIKTLPCKGPQKEKVTEKLNSWMDKHLGEKRYRVLDLANRIAGTGSVGVQRYIALLQEEESGRLRLADLKEAKPSSLLPYSKYEQPTWKNEAERIITLQKRVQHVAPAFLHTFMVGKTPFVVKELQPSEDRMDLKVCKGKKNKLADILITMAKTNASGQLRSGGRQGSSIADELIDFALNNRLWKKKLLLYTKQYAHQVIKDHAAYREDYANGLVLGV